jgi:hypothetical protein
MKNLAVFTGLAVILLALTGCKNPVNTEKAAAGGVIGKMADAGQPFPEFLVGIWDANDLGWEFKFELDGRISKLMHTGTPINVGEGGMYKQFGSGNSIAYALGPCETKYDPKTRQLSVKIVVDYCRMEVDSSSLEYRSIEYFDGPVSEDGKSWTADWRNLTWMEGAGAPDVNKPEVMTKLVFTKVDLKKVKH